MHGTEEKMAAGWAEEFDIEVDLPKFQGEVVDRPRQYLRALTQKLQKRSPKFLIKQLACLGR